MTKFSIIICTYNPRPEILERVLDSCLSQDSDHAAFEIILVDNNSTPPLEASPLIQTLASEKRIRLITEKKQGLTHARIAGVRNSTSDDLIFVDDDNVLDSFYLTKLNALRNNYPIVAIWGPGCILLDFFEGAPGWVKKHYAALFQQKNKIQAEFGCVKGWPDYYPAGTGMCVKKEVMETYIRHFEGGQISLTGRKGDTLQSAEDSQIVWTAVKMGHSAGTSPELKLTHVIPAKRTTRAYLARLNYGMAFSYQQALQEMFPEERGKFIKRTLKNKLGLIVRLMIRSGGKPLLFFRFYTIDNSWYRGLEAGAKYLSG
jgi:glycosyltransferase involved in cell wall biosynthesis